MKVKIHPTAIIIGVLLILKYGALVFFSCALAVFLHELSHLIISRERGYKCSEIIFLPYGAVLYNPNNLDKTSNIIIALSGPITNFLLALMSCAFFWIVPESYAFLRCFLYANFYMGIFNLLPIYPLDGGRIVMAIFGYKPRVRSVLKVLSIIVGIGLIIAYILTLKSTPNYTLLIMSVFLFLSAFVDKESDDYAYLLLTNPIFKNYSLGVEEKVIYIDNSTTLHRCLLIIKPNYKYTFVLVDKNNIKISEEDMITLINNNDLSTKVCELI